MEFAIAFSAYEAALAADGKEGTDAASQALSEAEDWLIAAPAPDITALAAKLRIALANDRLAAPHWVAALIRDADALSI